MPESSSSTVTCFSDILATLAQFHFRTWSQIQETRLANYISHVRLHTADDQFVDLVVWTLFRRPVRTKQVRHYPVSSEELLPLVLQITLASLLAEIASVAWGPILQKQMVTITISHAQRCFVPINKLFQILLQDDVGTVGGSWVPRQPLPRKAPWTRLR